MLLKVEKLSKNFGGVTAISNLDFDLAEGEVRGLIGPNGSGKSTFFNLVTGVYIPASGRIWFEDKDITSAEPHEIAALGIARTFQLLRIFSEMTVLENVMIGHHLHVNYGPLAAVFDVAKTSAEEKRIKQEMMELLAFVGLADYAELQGAELSIGQRRLLSLARAIAMRPKLLMLDEPAAGLSPANVDNLLNTISELKMRYGLTIIIIEHILRVVMNTCDRITVLDHGVKIGEGTPEEVRNNHAVIEAYLGREMNDEDVRKAITQ
jgi:branched-chain amino acid transport system ATP-binding protein